MARTALAKRLASEGKVRITFLRRHACQFGFAARIKSLRGCADWKRLRGSRGGRFEHRAARPGGESFEASRAKIRFPRRSASPEAATTARRLSRTARWILRCLAAALFRIPRGSDRHARRGFARPHRRRHREKLVSVQRECRTYGAPSSRVALRDASQGSLLVWYNPAT